MRIRTFALLAVFALVVAACSPTNDAADTSTTEGEPEPTTTSSEPVVEAPQAMLLSYTLEPGTTFEYEVGIDQTIEMTAEGDPNALGDEEIPGEMKINLTGTTTFSHSVAEGPDPGTFEITIKGDFSDLSITGTMDGTPIDSEIPDFAEIEPIDITIVVDEQGNIVPQDGEFGDLFGGDMGDLGGFGDFADPGADFGQFIGPPFSEDEVTVGDSWSETVETPGMMGDDPITTEINSTVTGTDTVDGYDVFVIETESVTSMIEFDLAEFLLGFFMAFIAEDATAEQTAELDAIMENLRFLFVIDETVSDLKTWFDFEAGYARKAEFGSATHMVIDINMPDETTGEMIGFVMDMNISQDVTYHLTDASSA